MIAGIDPALASLGYAISDGETILCWGRITTPASLSREQRLAVIYNQLLELFLEHKVEAVAIEDQFAGRNIVTLKALNQATGVVLLAAAHADAPAHLYAPTTVKSKVAGNGRANKEDVMAAIQAHFAEDLEVQRLFEHGPAKKDDIADAMGLILTYLAKEEEDA